MARILTSTFGTGSTAANVEMTSVAAGITMESAIAKVDPIAMKNSNLSASTQYASFQFAASNLTSALYYKFDWYVDIFPLGGSAPPFIFSTSDTSNAFKIALRATNGSALRLMNNEGSAQIGSDSPTLLTGRWYCIELLVDNSTLATTAVEARIDGVTFASGTVSQSTGHAKFFMGSSFDTTNQVWYFDNITINDTSAASENTWVGFEDVIHLDPASPGTVNTFATQTGGNSGSQNNYARVNETNPDDATTFNGSSTLNQEDLFRVTPIQSIGTVKALQLWARFRNSTADATAKITFEIKKISTGTTSSSSAVAPNTTTWNTNSTAAPHLPLITLYADPDGNPWTRDTINNDLLIGYKLTTGPGTAGRRIDVSKMWLVLAARSIQRLPQATMLNNYQAVKSGGLSVTEGIR